MAVVARRPVTSLHPVMQSLVNSVLANPTAPLVGKGLVQAAQAQANAAVSPALAALHTQLQQTRANDNALIGRTKGYYDTFYNHESGVPGTVGAQTDQAVGNIAGAGATTQGQMQGLRADEASREAADSALRGPGLTGDAAARVGSAVDNLAAHAASYSQADQDLARNSGSSWQNLASERVGSGLMRGQDALKQLGFKETNDTGKIQSELAADRAKRADLFAQALGTLRQQGITNAETQAGLNLKGSDIAARLKLGEQSDATRRAAINTAAKEAAARDQTTRRGQDLTSERATLDRTSRESIAAANRKTRAASGGKAPKYDKTAVDTVKTVFDDGLTHPAKIGQFGNIVTKATPYTPNEIATEMITKQHYPGWVVHAALDLHQHGYITPATAAMIPGEIRRTMGGRYFPPGWHPGAVVAPGPGGTSPRPG